MANNILDSYAFWPPYLRGISSPEGEPAAQRLTGSALRSLSGLFRVMRLHRFMLTAVAASLFSVAFMAYIEVASFIYVDLFGQTRQAYACFYAATAGISVLGPVAHLRFGKHASYNAFTYVLIFAGLASGIALLVAGGLSIWAFAAIMLVFSIAEATIRPYTAHMMLELAQSDIGSASAMISFLSNAFGVIGMVLIMLPFTNYVFGLGVLMTVSMAVAVPVWIAACRSKDDASA
ncbi:MAG: hypothetical protein LUB61_07080 [Eggerthellaceae bacterium]|nr:hypothetical protein [Eggerthellaceae bacterium]